MSQQGDDEKAAAARRWLESLRGDDAPPEERNVFNGSIFSSLKVSHAAGGRALCTLRIPAHPSGGEGRWPGGAITTVVDLVGAAAIMTTEGVVKVTVDISVSYFSPAFVGEEVEIDATVTGHKGRASGAVVEIRKKGGAGDGGRGELVAVGKAWMTSGRPLVLAKKGSKL